MCCRYVQVPAHKHKKNEKGFMGLIRFFIETKSQLPPIHSINYQFKDGRKIVMATEESG